MRFTSRTTTSLAAEFTPGEDAALGIIADECRVHGFCDLSNDAIAARAGGHRTTVQSALRKARELGLICRTAAMSSAT
jgi:hypothetical protein